MKRVISRILILVLLITALLAGGAANAGSVSKKIGILLEGESVEVFSAAKVADEENLQWVVSNASVISAEGRQINAISAGTAIASVQYHGATARMGIIVLPKEISIKIGDSYQLSCGGVEAYRVKDKKVARVDSKGIIYGIGAGATMVGVKYGKQVRYVNVNVEMENVPENQSRVAELDCAATAEQIVLVEYSSGSNATLSIHEKQNGAWTELASCNAYVGKNGIGKTVEGDKKTPTGTYNLTTPFGIKADPGSKLPYTQVTKYHYWCGRSSSEYYNQLVDTRETGTSVTSSDEYLIKYKGVYNYCMFIDYNAEGVAGKGSCIFLHCKGSNKYTAGCIAIDEDFMVKILKWADAGCKIVIQ